jgi:hypothetical protein
MHLGGPGKVLDEVFFQLPEIILSLSIGVAEDAAKWARSILTPQLASQNGYSDAWRSSQA